MSDMKEIKNLAALRGCTVAAMLAASLSIGDGKTAGIKQPQPKLDTKEMPTAPNVSPVVDKPIVTPVIDSVNVEKDMPPRHSYRRLWRFCRCKSASAAHP